MKFSITSTFAIFSLFAISAFAAPVAVPAANAIGSPEAKAVAAAFPESHSDFVNGAVANLTAEIGELTQVLNSSSISNVTLNQIIDVVAELVEGAISTLGEETGNSDTTDSINSLLNKAIPALEAILEATGTSDSLNEEITTVEELLTAIVSTINNVESEYNSKDTIGVITSLLSGLLSVLRLYAQL